jgi:hypothetical protein
MPSAPPLAIQEECIEACNAVDNSLSPPSGLTALSISQFSYPFHGFYAEAFRDPSNNIIVAFKQSTPDLNPLDKYGFYSGLADAALMLGQSPSALSDAVNFVNNVLKQVTSGHIYLAGHSLGGTEAEAAALAESSNTRVSGGVTFGATGLPAYFGTTAQPNFIDYVDYGDFIGNYARDSSSRLNLISALGYHFGTVVKVGNPQDESDINHALDVASSSGLEGIPAVILSLSDSAKQYHGLDNYGNGSVIPGLSTAPSLSVALFNPNVAFILTGQAAAVSPPPTPDPHPVLTGSLMATVGVTAAIQLSSLVAASEANAGGHHIDHYTLINTLEGPGNFVVDSQVVSGNALNVTPAEFANATFSAGANAGVNEIVVVAFDDLGNASNAFVTKINVAGAEESPQPINTSDHTPPTIVPPAQQLLTGVGSNPTLTATYLEATDPNYSPAQLLYVVTSGPSHGYLLKGGQIVTSFTQSDINNGLIVYQENGAVTPSDSFTYQIFDPAGNHTAAAAFSMQIASPPIATNPQLTTNTALDVGQGLTSVITSNNLHVTDGGVNPWQIIYTVTSDPLNGQIIADGVNVVHSFTQQQVDLGLIAYRNTANASGVDHVNFTVSDGSGGSIGSTEFDFNVIPHNNLSVQVIRPLFTDPIGQYYLHTFASDGGIQIGSTPYSTFTSSPGWFSLISRDILSAVDPGVDPSNITYTITSLGGSNNGMIIGQWGTPQSTSYVPYTGRSIGQSDIINNFPHSFTQAEVNAGEVFFRDGNTSPTYGSQFSLQLSVTDNVGNSLGTITLPVIEDSYGLLSDSTFTPRSSIPTINLSAPIGETKTIGRGSISFISNQFSDSQITYSIWYLPSDGTILLNGVALSKSSTFTQEDIDRGRLAYHETGAIVTSDKFGLFVTDPNSPSGTLMVLPVSVAMTGNHGGQVLAGSTGAETLSAGMGNNYFLGNAGTSSLASGHTKSVGTGVTIVSYANSPNSVEVDLLRGTARNGYGGTDALTSIHTIIGSSYGDVFHGGASPDSFYGGAGADTFIAGPAKDVFYGGPGADHFVFTNWKYTRVGPNHDIIADFSHTDGDKIDLSGIDANLTKLGHQHFVFIGTDTFAHYHALHPSVIGMVRFAHGMLQGNVNAHLVADFAIEVHGVTSLHASDLLL